MLFFNHFTHSLKNIAKRFILVFICFSFHLTTFTHAASPSGGGRWPDKTVTRVGLDDIIEATARQQVTRNGSSVTLEAVVRETVNRRAVGKVLLSRLLAGGVLVGATQSLLDGIGWVMEDGVYIKRIPPAQNPNTPPNSEYFWQTTVDTNTIKYFESASAAFEARSQALCKSYSTCVSSSYKINDSSILAPTFEGLVGSKATINLKFANNSTNSYPMSQTQRTKNPNYDPDKPKPEPQKIVLTDQLMGDIAVGDYTDPVDSSKDKKDRKWTGVEDAYKHHPGGTGNELSDGLDDKMDNAPETPKKPTTGPVTDGEGQKYPTDKDKGTEGNTEQEKDPETGEPTGQGKFNLPAWCLWAKDNCDWHQEDKKHQTEEKTVWEDEKKHRGDEKTFWQSVKDFFKWFTEPPEPENQDNEVDIDDTEVQKPELNISIGDNQCPSYRMDFDMGFMVVPIDLSPVYLCQIAEGIRAFFIALGFYIASLIVGRRVQ
ncbi:hypothetical protein [Acinetobacter sp. SEK570]|uniref:hypothetical protein n=1 Tax=unclassified Acinetobacter TaxID=196816 RepID=UPI00399F0874